MTKIYLFLKRRDARKVTADLAFVLAGDLDWTALDFRAFLAGFGLSALSRALP